MNKTKDILYKIFIKYQGLVLLLIFLDQLSKRLALKYITSPIYIFNLQWLQLKVQINSGVAFSFLKDAPQWISAAISIIAALGIEIYLIKKKPKNKFIGISLLFIIAGAVGNGIDRWLSVFGQYTGYSGVIDFIYPTFFANFNVADIYVTVSCILLLIYFIITPEKDEKIKKEIVNDTDKKEAIQNLVDTLNKINEDKFNE